MLAVCRRSEHAFACANCFAAEPRRVQRRPLIRLIRLLLPVLLAAPGFDLQCVHGRALEFLLCHGPVFPARRHVGKYLEIRACSTCRCSSTSVMQPRRPEHHHGPVLQRELKRDIGWQRPADFAHLRADARVAFDVGAQSSNNVGMKYQPVSRLVEPVVGRRDERLVVPARPNVRDLATAQTGPDPIFVPDVVRAALARCG